MEFTKGPWVKTKCESRDHDGSFDIRHKDGELIFCIEPWVTNEGDAHLIAAAPEMYEALEETVREWESRGQEKYGLGAPASMFKVQAALAKAKGEVE